MATGQAVDPAIANIGWALMNGVRDLDLACARLIGGVESGLCNVKSQFLADVKAGVRAAPPRTVKEEDAITWVLAQGLSRPATGALWVNYPGSRKTCDLVVTWPDGRSLWVEVTVRFQKPEVIRVGLDGKSEQPAFRCGASHGGKGGIVWADWPAALVRRGAADGPALRVFVTRHSLDQLRDQVIIEGPEIEDFMWQSLLQPTLHPTARSDEFLAEYRLYQHLLGHFPVRRLADKVVVKTFLFLTMDGTLQQRLLLAKLGLERWQQELAGLDRLSLFLTTDVQDDPVLRRVFVECGCGGLLDMATPELRARARVGVANDLRRFLGIRDEADLAKLGVSLEAPADSV